MSNDLPKTPQSEEVDLGQLFKLIGNAFSRLFNFIGSILNSIFLAFVWFVFFIKKHILKLGIAGIIGIAVGFYFEKTADPVYKSYITVKQNYQIGENLYNSISYFNDLVGQNDIQTLVNSIGINKSDALKILGFSVEPVISNNQKIQRYDTYRKTLDSVVASTITYEMYIKNTEDFAYDYQQISIQAKERSNFKKVFDKIIEGINSNQYFKREQEKDLTELKEEELALVEALNKSDSLQKTYKRVLEKVSEKAGGQTSITIEGSTQVDKTKELELYKSDLELREKLILNRRIQSDKQYILESISSKQDSGIIDNSKKLFGFTLSTVKYYFLIFVGLTFIALLGISFISYLDKFKKENA